MILACQSIQKAFGTDVILKNASFHIEDREKAAIVGINGAGKSTLLKIIMHQLDPDSGDVILAKGKTIGYLAQHDAVSSENTIHDELLSVKAELLARKKGSGSWNWKEIPFRRSPGKAYWKPITGLILSLSVKTVMPSKANSPAF